MSKSAPFEGDEISLSCRDNGSALPLPLFAGLSGEKSCIGEPQLIKRELWIRFARIDWWWSVDFRYRFPHEQAFANEFGEAQRQHSRRIQTLREAQEQIGDHGSDDLQANSVVVLAHELA